MTKKHRYDAGVSPELEITEIATSATKDSNSPWLRPELVASWWEIAAVLILTIGYYVYCSTLLGLYRWSGHIPNLRPTNYGAVHVLVGQSTILALLLLFLNWRGWIPADLKIKPGWWSSLQALPLLMADFFVLCVGIVLIHYWTISHPAQVASKPYLHANITHFWWAALIARELINAYFEEVICMCYAFNQFAAKRGPLFALGLMLLLRISYHTWKSPAYLCIAVIGFLIYGLWYWRTRNVWPLILAHVCFDVLLGISQIR